MASESLVTVMAVAVSISALAMLAMAIMVFAMFKSLIVLRDQVQVFLPKAESLVTSATRTLSENQQQIRDITTRTALVMEAAQRNAVKVDAAVADGLDRAKVQLERLELIMGDTLERVHDTVVAVNNTVLRPVREVNGVASGVKAAVKHLIRANRPTPEQATSDEEMFI